MRIRLRHIFILIVIVILLGIAPFAMGLIFKSSYLDLLRADQTDKVQIQSYDVGWFTSDAKIHLTLKPNSSDISDDGITVPSGVTLVQHITHGPYLRNPVTGKWTFAKAAIETQVHLDPRTEGRMLGAHADLGVMQINTIVSMLNNYFNQLQSPVITTIMPNNAKLTWQGLTGTISTNISGVDVTHITTDLKIGALTVQGSANSLTIAQSSVQNDIACDADRICTGTQSVFFPEITSTNQKGDNVKLTSLTLNFGGDEKNNNYSNNYEMTVKNIVSADNSAGPANFKFAVNNLNAAEIVNLSTKIRTDQKDVMDIRSRQLMLAGELNSGLAKLFTPDTTVTGDFKLVTPSGNLVATAKMFWPANNPLPLDTQDLAARINIHADIRAAAALVDQFVKMIDDKQNPPVTATAPVQPAKIDFEAALPSITQFKNQLDVMVKNTQISSDVSTKIAAMQAQQLAPQEMNAYIDSLVTSKQLSATAANTLKTAYGILFMGEQRGMLITIFSVPATNTQTLGDKVDALVKMKIVSQPTGNELIELQNQSLSPEIYSVALHKFVDNKLISTDVESQLKAQYAAINKDLSLDPDAAVGVASTAPAAPDALAPPPPVGKMQMQLDALKKRGYLVKDKDDYVMSIVYANGVFKINGLAPN